VIRRVEPRETLYVEHMLDAIRRLRRHVGRKGRAAFLRSELLQDAVMRNIEIIGEAAGRVSRAFAEKHAAIPWRDIVGMRHRLIHGYTQVNLDKVWNVVVHDLPQLEEDLRAMLSPPRASRKGPGRRRR